LCAQKKRAGLNYGSGMDMFDWQLQKRDAQLREGMALSSAGGRKVGSPIDFWRAYHPEAAHH
jgi:hypothetical protein